MTQDATDQVPPRLSGAARWLFFAGGVAIPVALLLVAGEADRPSWQDGTLATYSTLVLRQVPRVFWGFFAYSVGSMLLLIATPEGLAQRGRSFAVRLGIYTGVLVSVQLVVQFTLIHDEWEFRALTIVGNSIAILLWPAVPLSRWLARWLGDERLGVAAAAVVLLAYIAAWLLLDPGIVAMALVGGSIAAVPGFMLLAYLRMSWLVCSRCGAAGRFCLSGLLAWVTWLAAYFGAWRIAVTRAIDEYASLPTVQPGCFICTAAARGHPKFVKSRLTRGSGGTSFMVNRQVRHLKCAELALLAGAPWLHRACRLLYDRYGPWLARRIDNPLAADIAYLLLKPAEWTAYAALRLLVPDIDEAAARICPPMEDGGRRGDAVMSGKRHSEGCLRSRGPVKIGVDSGPAPEIRA